MTNKTILLIDADVSEARGLNASLQYEGYQVICERNGLEGLTIARTRQPDLIILDTDILGMNGLEFCRRLRQESDDFVRHTPLIFISSRIDTSDVIAGLDEGADDYLCKPLKLSELKARIRVCLRRSKKGIMPQSDKSELALGPFRLNLQARWVAMADEATQEKRVQLTLAEFDLFQHFMTHPNQLFSSKDLLRDVWSYAPGMADPSLTRWHIKNLRKKIEPNPKSPKYIRTIARMGYMLSV